MSRRQIAEMTYKRWHERDVAAGIPDTPEHREFLRDIAEDFADQMDADAREEMRGRDAEMRGETDADDDAEDGDAPA